MWVKFSLKGVSNPSARINNPASSGVLNRSHTINTEEKAVYPVPSDIASEKNEFSSKQKENLGELFDNQTRQILDKTKEGHTQQNKVILEGIEEAKQKALNEIKEREYQQHAHQTEKITEVFNVTKQEVLDEIREMNVQQNNKIINEILDDISGAYKLYGGEDEESKQKLQNATDLDVVIELSIPILKLVGINIVARKNITDWLIKLFQKIGLPKTSKYIKSQLGRVPTMKT